jgi:hypothetical protein
MVRHEPSGGDLPTPPKGLLDCVSELGEAIKRGDVPPAGVLGTDPPEVRALKLVNYGSELMARGELTNDRPRKLLWDRDPSPLRGGSQFSVKELLRAAAHLEPIAGEMARETQKRILRLAWYDRASKEISRPVSGAPASRLRQLADELFRLRSPFPETVLLLWDQEDTTAKHPATPRQVRKTVKAKKRFLQTLAQSYRKVMGEPPPRVPGFLSKRILLS